MRVFIAIELSNKIKDKLENLQSSVRRLCPMGNYSSWDNFHLTLKFIGEIDKSKIEDIKVCLDNIGRVTNKFSINLMDLGRFKKRNRFVVWTGVNNNTSLLKLYGRIEICLVDNGFIREDRDFRPHITLGRNVFIEVSSLSDIIENESMEVESICLMEGKRVDGDLRYVPIYRSLLMGV